MTKYKGSISAEHGIANKIEYLHLQKSNEILNIHKQIKKMFDPKGIMNPYKCIPEWSIYWKINHVNFRLFFIFELYF